MKFIQSSRVYDRLRGISFTQPICNYIPENMTLSFSPLGRQAAKMYIHRDAWIWMQARNYNQYSQALTFFRDPNHYARSFLDLHWHLVVSKHAQASDGSFRTSFTGFHLYEASKEASKQASKQGMQEGKLQRQRSIIQRQGSKLPVCDNALVASPKIRGCRDVLRVSCILDAGYVGRGESVGRERHRCFPRLWTPPSTAFPIHLTLLVLHI